MQKIKISGNANKRRKKILAAGMCVALLFSTSACGRSAERPPDANTAIEVSSSSSASAEEESRQKEADIDLSSLSANVQYAEVVNILNNMDTYDGKRLKVRGYFKIVTDDDGNRYNTVEIADSAQDCEQNIEFTIASENTSDSEAIVYPEEGSEIDVTGTISSYLEDGTSMWYCRLNDAEVDLVSV